MPVELEAARHERADPLRAPGNLEHTIAATTAEVVVMLCAGGLIARWLTRQLDRDDHAFCDERFESPIYGRSSQPGHLGLGAGEDLHRRERPPFTLDGAENRGALSRRSFHRSLEEG
jgi:hypothetical protein